jgi:hypothetical protein
MVECFTFGLIWRGLMHDLSKFLPSEFIPYANHFYNKDGSKKEKRNKTGYYKPIDTGDEAFDFAWLLHQKRNRHHWQWWVLSEDEGNQKIFLMDTVSMYEMICDWIGAGKAQGFVSPKNDRFKETREWYNKNKNKMHLHEYTRDYIEDILGV